MTAPTLPGRVETCVRGDVVSSDGRIALIWAEREGGGYVVFWLRLRNVPRLATDLILANAEARACGVERGWMVRCGQAGELFEPDARVGQAPSETLSRVAVTLRRAADTAACEARFHPGLFGIEESMRRACQTSS